MSNSDNSWRPRDIISAGKQVTVPASPDYKRCVRLSAMQVQAACHIHSCWSYDGSRTLEDLAAKFRRRGCRVLMTTEHDRGFTPSRLDDYREACARASSAELLIVPGMEYSDPANRVHILVWGSTPFFGEGMPTSELLTAVGSVGGVAVLAHPSRRNAWACVDQRWTSRLLGIEVWNRKYDGWAPSRTAPGLLEMTSAVPFVGLDFHTERQSFPLTMVLDLASDVTQNTVLECLRSRRCHAHAFGLSLSESSARKALPVLRLAERGRKLAAWLARHSWAPAR